MTTDRGVAGHPADPEGPIDARDAEVLKLLRECYDTVDPMPQELVETTLFALALHRPDTDFESGLVELAKHSSLEKVATRGEEARVVTFESESLTIMIRISARDETVRIDGWLAPPGPGQVELRTEQRTIPGSADEEGRFVFEDVPRGLAQLSVREPATGGSAGQDRTVVTPAIVL